MNAERGNSIGQWGTRCRRVSGHLEVCMGADKARHEGRLPSNWSCFLSLTVTESISSKLHTTPAFFIVSACYCSGVNVILVIACHKASWENGILVTNVILNPLLTHTHTHTQVKASKIAEGSRRPIRKLFVDYSHHKLLHWRMDYSKSTPTRARKLVPCSRVYCHLQEHVVEFQGERLLPSDLTLLSHYEVLMLSRRHTAVCCCYCWNRD